VEALDCFGAVRRRVVDELGVEPGPELRRLHEEILRQDVAATAAPCDLPPALDLAVQQPLIGREEQLAWLRERWLRATAGTGVTVRVVGPQGSGKTRLAAELAEEVHVGGGDVLYATGADATLREVLEQAREATAPTLLMLDDVDGAGPAELDAIAGLADAVPRYPVLLVVVSAPDLGPAETLTLGGLDEHAAHAVVSAYAVDQRRVGRAELVHGGERLEAGDAMKRDLGAGLALEVLEVEVRVWLGVDQVDRGTALGGEPDELFRRGAPRDADLDDETRICRLENRLDHRLPELSHRLSVSGS
jgi:hypothetical protein